MIFPRVESWPRTRPKHRPGTDTGGRNPFQIQVVDQVDRPFDGELKRPEFSVSHLLAEVSHHVLVVGRLIRRGVLLHEPRAMQRRVDRTQPDNLVVEAPGPGSGMASRLVFSQNTYNDTGPLCCHSMDCTSRKGIKPAHTLLPIRTRVDVLS